MQIMLCVVVPSSVCSAVCYCAVISMQCCVLLCRYLYAVLCVVVSSCALQKHLCCMVQTQSIRKPDDCCTAMPLMVSLNSLRRLTPESCAFAAIVLMVLHLQNPEGSEPPNAGLNNKADYKGSQKKQFGGYRWIGCQDPSLLDVQRCEFLFIGARGGEDIKSESS